MIPMPIEKKIVMNEMQQPVAVQINYQDWLKIEQQLSLESVPARRKPLCALHTFRATLTKSSKSRVNAIKLRLRRNACAGCAGNAISDERF